MKIATAGLLVACLLSTGGLPAAAQQAEVKPTVRFARSWADAVELGKFLNAPIVVHSHGFS